MATAVEPLSANASRKNSSLPVGVSASSENVRRTGEESVDRYFATARSLPPFDVRSDRAAMGPARPTAKIFDRAGFSTARVAMGWNKDCFQWAASNNSEMFKVLIALSGEWISASVGSQGAIAKTFADLDLLLTWQDGWNGYDAAAPNSKAITLARKWIMGLYSQVLLSSHLLLSRPWIEPNVTADAGGEVVFGWWYGKKELSIYVTADSVEYMQVWGPNVVSDMSEGDAEPFLARLALWQWLLAP